MELFDAVSKNDVIHVMRLLELGVDPNQFDSDRQYTALHYAVHSNAIDVVLLLITAGADLEKLTEENMTVFDIAREHRNEEMMHLLMKLAHMKMLKRKKYYQN
jgi:ankyrin repeat protein